VSTFSTTPMAPSIKKPCFFSAESSNKLLYFRSVWDKKRQTILSTWPQQLVQQNPYS
jgi:hypothetical protein